LDFGHLVQHLKKMEVRMQGASFIGCAPLTAQSQSSLGSDHRRLMTCIGE